MWLNEGTFGNGPADLTPDITFDLGQVRSIDQMKVWNYNEWLPGRARATWPRHFQRGCIDRWRRSSLLYIHYEPGVSNRTWHEY